MQLNGLELEAVKLSENGARCESVINFGDYTLCLMMNNDSL